MIPKISFILICLVIVSALSACDKAAPAPSQTTSQAPQTSPPTNPTPPADSSKPVLIDATAPEILTAATAPGASVTIVNVWATWCSPCVEEFPYLIQLHKNYKDKGLRLVLVSFDYEKQTNAVLQFLQKNGVTFPTYRRSGPDQTFITELAASWTGSLPLTLIYDGQGKLRRAWERDATYQEFEEATLKILEEKPQ